MFENLRLHLLAHTVRISTGLVLFLSGLSKLLDMNGFASFVSSTSSLSFGSDIIAMTWPWIEVILGLMLIIGLFTQVAAALAAFFFLGVSIFMGITRGIGLQFHTFVFLTSLALTLGGKQQGPTLDSFLDKKLRGKVEKIKV